MGSIYRLERKIGSGGFGACCLSRYVCQTHQNICSSVRLTEDTKGLDDNTGDKVAIKLKYNSMEFSSLQNEVSHYKTLAGGA